MKKWKKYSSIAMILGLALLFPVSAKAAQPQTIYNSPYVTFSPDGLAWTTNAGEKEYTWYAFGTTVSTGIASSLRALQTGEHYYSYSRAGTIPIGKWVVNHWAAECIHHYYTDENTWHGISFARSICRGHYNSGWQAYCADCGEVITDMLVYMSQAAAESIDYLDVGTGLSYYFLCPWNNNLEQGDYLRSHVCKTISWNQYKVHYDANTAQPYGGYMADSTHMYNNELIYEGKAVTPATHLTKNVYTRIGYVFVEWNTKPDGSGTGYADGAEVLNLTDKDINADGSIAAAVTLYAQWRPSSSTLQIDPDGGKYNGNSGITTVKDDYGNTYLLDSSKVTPPAGYTVYFEANGGDTISSITGTQSFVEWSQKQPFEGRVKDDRYHFIAPDGNVDTLKAVYKLDPITLPTPHKDNSSFGGWYYDPEFEQPAGSGGDTIIPSKDTTLYAQWVELLLYAEDDYESNGGKGAIDLSWSQPDSKGKTYKIYQSRDGKDWTRINTADDIDSTVSIKEDFSYSGKTQTYIVPYTGFYTITAQGAQGGNYGSKKGGLGGEVSAKVWLSKGEILTYNIGGQNGYNGGGSGNMSNGGGMTNVSTNLKGTILIAGGGGGATPDYNGGAGGSQEGLAKDSKGENSSAGAGGGGGYQGGKAGEYVQHFHTASCRHYHTGSNGSGCYTVPKGCSGTIYSVTETYGGTYWWIDGESAGYCVQCGAVVGVSECIGHHWGYRTFTCLTCGYSYSNSGAVSSTSTKTFTITSACKQVTYGLGCKYKDFASGALVCNYRLYSDGYVISSKPAYGGSNYINTHYVTDVICCEL